MKKLFPLVFVISLWSSSASATVIEFNDDGTVTTYKARDYLAEQRHSRIKPEVPLFPITREPKDHFSEIINATAHKYSVKPAIIHAAIRTESFYRADALSPKGAQ